MPWRLEHALREGLAAGVADETLQAGVMRMGEMDEEAKAKAEAKRAERKAQVAAAQAAGMSGDVPHLHQHLREGSLVKLHGLEKGSTFRGTFKVCDPSTYTIHPLARDQERLACRLPWLQTARKSACPRTCPCLPTLTRHLRST